MPRSVVIHGHFYQPPREDPWLEEVETEPSAAPYHDWNERIERECYRTVTAARLLGADGRIDRIVNTLALISFNFGPTLLEWLERAAPEVYEAVLEADRAGRARLGHGNAIAQPYHHAILPLSTRRDKETEVRWGIADFRRRFGRDPEGMWLPETAVDDETLDVLAAEGIRFTILAPHQVRRAPHGGRPGLYRTAGGRSIALFVYDGGLSHAVAFGGLLNDAHAWAERMVSAGDRHHRPQLVSIATDGETYGHHHRFGEMALARMLEELEHRRRIRVENYASFLAAHPPEEEVELAAPSSWSCSHGVERWRAHCGCRIAQDAETQQRWRTPLREAVQQLAEDLHRVFGREGAAYFGDPWAARDAYGAVVGADPAALERFAREWIAAGANGASRVRGRELLEMERDALRIFTSCAWFFDDVGGLEPLQVMRYAAHAIELAGAEGPRIEERFLARLAEAESNDESLGNGRDIYLRRAKPRVPPMVRVAAGFATMRHLAASDALRPLECCDLREESGRVTLGRRRTGRVHEFETSVEVLGSRDLTVTVRAAGGGVTTYLGLGDLPERDRLVAAATLRRRLIERALSDRERALLGDGVATLAQVLPAALVRAIRGLRDDHSPEALAHVDDLLDLFESAGIGIPYDAQTAFYRSRAALGPDGAEALAPLGWRLGFAEADRASPTAAR